MGQFPNPDTQFKPGHSGNPAGKPKGTKHLSTWIDEMLNDEEFEARILDAKTGLADYKGAPVKAIVKVAITKSINGDQRWADWLARHGYGTRVDSRMELEAEVTVNVKEKSDEELDAIIGEYQKEIGS